MWVWKVATGELFFGNARIAVGYSGYGTDKNQPNDESVKDLGPLPEGTYLIGAPQCVDEPGPHGPFVLPLTPTGDTSMFGRSGFLIHGDSIEHPGTASHGCIILPRAVRQQIALSSEKRLSVVSGQPVSPSTPLS